MAQAGPIRRVVIPVVCLVATGLGLNNVYGDTTAVERLAEETACGAPGCAAQQIAGNRSPLSHQYTYQLDLKSVRTRSVECKREYVLVGEYHCTLLPFR
jgi:hypothetical protein